MTEENKGRQIGYWVLTAMIVLPFVGGAIGNTMHAEHPMEMVVNHLGYPAYLLTILGIAKGIAAVIVAAPGLKRLKEWAYAGMSIDLIGAAASHVLVDGPMDLKMVLFPLALLAVALGSWHLRPPSRRLAD